eukprot:115287-Pleurochrysis_carterae.AAC.5
MQASAVYAYAMRVHAPPRAPVQLLVLGPLLVVGRRLQPCPTVLNDESSQRCRAIEHHRTGHKAGAAQN